MFLSAKVGDVRPRGCGGGKLPACFLLAWGLIAIAPRAARAGDCGASTATQERIKLLPPFEWGSEKQWRLEVGGDQRIRFERLDNLDLNKKNADNDDVGTLRTRLNFELTYRARIRTYVEIADVREIGARVPLGQEAYAHIHQFYVEAPLGEGSPWSVRVGRQRMSFGDGRLVSEDNWLNLIPLFDGVRLRYQGNDIDANFFVVRPDTYQRLWHGRLVSGRPRPIDSAWFTGTYVSLSKWKSHTWDVYAFGLSDNGRGRSVPAAPSDESGRVGRLRRYTLGTRLVGTLHENPGVGTLGYGLEAAWQFGRVAQDRIRAAMAHADINYQWDKPWKPMLKLEGNLASGDRRLGDGTLGTFDPLFPGTYSVIDKVRLQNLREVALTFKFQPASKLTIQTQARRYWLDSTTDAWPAYGLRDPSGKSGRAIGTELSLVATYEVSKRATLEAAVGRLLPGGFPKSFGNRDSANYVYVQYEWRF